MYEVEDIPDDNKLYYRIHKGYVRDGEITPGAFREIQDGMSADWEKYSTPMESRQRARKPLENAIISFVVYQLRNLTLQVIHNPARDNRAHSLIKGKEKKIQNDNRVRLGLLNVTQWEIRLSQDN